MQVIQNIVMYVLPFVLVLGVVVTVHELGHFLAAKWLGTKIDRFSIGFGRALASWRDGQGVEWRVGWLPLGGYVRFAGDDNASSIPDVDDLDQMRRDVVRREGQAALSRYFHFKPLWQRAIIVAAGPLANFALAVLIFAALLMTVGERVATTRVDRVVPGSAAEQAGFKPGDVILKMDGRKVTEFEQVSNRVVLSSGTPIAFLVQRGGAEVTIVATPRRGVVQDALGKSHRLGQLGLFHETKAGEATYRRYGPVDALIGGVERVGSTIETTVRYVSRMFLGRESADQLAGPLGMAQMSGDLASHAAKVSPDAGTLALNALLIMLQLIAAISVGIGFMNLLPVPVLDGGHLLFYAYEAVARRPLAAKVQAAGYRVGLALVLGLMLFATWNDLQRLRVFNLFGGLFS
ncbi:M50 family metallopeptidase [Phenylobacterium sp. VNQ135]|uniref:M50 family metallopeptidase n=1 Tax=Phenylobacterium sp. VNQ135 TaxID=3400922 RepID=UPI003C06FB0E